MAELVGNDTEENAAPFHAIHIGAVELDVSQNGKRVPRAHRACARPGQTAVQSIDLADCQENDRVVMGLVHRGLAEEAGVSA